MDPNELIDEKWKNRKPTFDDFGITESDYTMNIEAHEAYDKWQNEKAAKFDSTGKLADAQEGSLTRWYSIVIPVFTIIIAIIIYPHVKAIGDPGNGPIMVMVATIIGALIAQCLPSAIAIEVIKKLTVEKKQQIIITNNLESIKGKERQLQRRYEKYLQLDDAVEEYNKALCEYNYWEEKQRHEEELREYNYWEQMQGGDGIAFELACAEYLTNQGFDTMTTKRSHDGGIDIIAEKRNRKYACQCKALGTKVSSGEMHKLVGALMMDSYDGGVFFSLNGFSAQAKEIAKTAPKIIQCFDKHDLVEGRLLR